MWCRQYTYVSLNDKLFPGINVSQGSVATYASSGWIFNDHFTVNLPGNFPVKKIVNRLRFDIIMAMSFWPHFFDPPYISVYNHQIQ